MKKTNHFSPVKFTFQLLIALFIGLQPFSLSAQKDSKTRRLIRNADNYFHTSRFNEALSLYLEILESNPTDFTYNYRTGICYLNSNKETQKSVEYFETAQKHMNIPNDSTADFYSYLGHSYKITNQYQRAIKNLILAKGMLDQSVDSLNVFYIKAEIKQCLRGEESKLNPVGARLFDLGAGVNSIYPDYSSVIVPDQSLLVFTTTRKSESSNQFQQHDDYFEDVYTSANQWNDSTNTENIESPNYVPDFTGVDFDTAQSPGIFINSRYNDASISMTPDDNKIFLFRDEEIWETPVKEGELGIPVKYNYMIGGEKRIESSIDITHDNKILYFVSDQDGGIGGKDIYRSKKKEDGTWGVAENVGPVINTNYDEEAVFYDVNEDMLYFSSRGHNSIGGYDVYRSKFDNDVWSEPENLGYPINSGADDVFFTFDSQNNKGYISTMRMEGQGNFDIYLVRYFKPLEVYLASNYSAGLAPLKSKLTIVSLTNGDSVQVTLDKANDITYKSNEKFKLTVPHYENDSVVDVFEFETPESYGDFSYYQEIDYEDIKNHKGQLIGYTTTLYNAFFDIEQELGKTGKIVTTDAEKEIAYSSFVKGISSENEYFQKFSKTHYIDTSIYDILEEQIASRALAAGISGEVKVPLTPTAAKTMLKEVATVPVDSMMKVVAVEPKPVEETPAPAKAPAVIVAKAVATPSGLSPILFQFSSQSLTTTGKAQLEEIYNYLTANKNVSIKILGYADSKGTTGKNSDLATRRAIEVKLLLMQKGIAKSRLKAIGRGEKDPVAPNTNTDNSDNPDGRTLNRRVEFEVF